MPSPDSPIRWNLVNRLKAEIADGTYETEEKLAAAVDGLQHELEQQLPEHDTSDELMTENLITDEDLLRHRPSAPR